MELLLNVLTKTVGFIAKLSCAYSCGDNYHQNCKARQIDNDGQSCPFCFLALDKDIPESGTRDEHKIGQCIFKD